MFLFSACPGAICDTAQATQCDGIYGGEKLDGITFHTIFEPLIFKVKVFAYLAELIRAI